MIPESRRWSDDADGFEQRAALVSLREAIEGLINAKLNDALRPGGLQRLVAHRGNGVASPDIRSAERRLDQALMERLSFRRQRRRDSMNA
jgi:hypothetical protein